MVGWRTRIAALGASSVLLLTSVIAPSATAAADVDPPVGTLTIEGGASWTNHTTLSLDVTATDDVGVTEVWVRHDLGPWTVFPYAPQIAYSLGDPATVPDGGKSLDVSWYDAAGNANGAIGSITLDRVAPTAPLVNEVNRNGPFGTIRMWLAASEEVSGMPYGEFSPNGSSWGAALPLTETGETDWDVFDPAVGGAPTYGVRTSYARIRDGAGNWSPATKFTFEIAPPTPTALQWPANAQTGHKVTIHVVWPSGAPAPPASTRCLWTLVWGNKAARSLAQHDETYGYVTTSGLAADGFCADWTISLPWVPVREFGVEFHVGQSGLEVGFDGPPLTATVDSMDRHITSSSLRAVYVLPTAYEAVLGESVTYQVFALNGASLGGGLWDAQTGDYTPIRQNGGSTFTFTPNRVGHWRVSWAGGSGQATYGAGFDPPVRAAPGGGGGGASSPPASATATPTASESAVPSDSPALTATPSTSVVATDEPSETLGAGALATPEPASPTGSGGPAAGGVALAAALAVLGGGLAAWRVGWLAKLPRRVRELFGRD